jgi:hypothetical protein
MQQDTVTSFLFQIYDLCPGPIEFSPIELHTDERFSGRFHQDYSLRVEINSDGKLLSSHQPPSVFDAICRSASMVATHPAFGAKSHPNPMSSRVTLLEGDIFTGMVSVAFGITIARHQPPESSVHQPSRSNIRFPLRILRLLGSLIFSYPLRAIESARGSKRKNGSFRKGINLRDDNTSPEMLSLGCHLVPQSKHSIHRSLPPYPLPSPSATP